MQLIEIHLLNCNCSEYECVVIIDAIKCHDDISMEANVFAIQLHLLHGKFNVIWGIALLVDSKKRKSKIKVFGLKT